METNKIKKQTQPLNTQSSTDNRTKNANQRHKQRIEHRHKPPDCNLYSCKQCNINWKPRSTEERQRYSQVRQERPPKKSNKFCNLDCKVCTAKLERIEETSRWFSMNNTDSPPKPKESRFKNTTTEELISETDQTNYIEQQNSKDAESFWRSLLTAAGENQHLYDELKLQLPEIVEKWSNTVSTARTRLVREHINDKVPATPDLIAAIADYTATNFIIHSRGEIKTIKANPNSEEYIFLKHSQNSEQMDIYTNLKPIHNIPAFKLENFKKAIRALLRMENQGDDQPPTELREFIFLVWNCRKMRSQLKADILNDIALSRETDFILLQETHLSSEENLRMRNYKVFRSDSETHTKGTAILVNKRVNAQCMVMQRDQEGRSIKLRVEDPDTNIAYTISNLYHEPSAEEDIINPLFFASDIVAGDCNDHLTGLETYCKYHFKNLTRIDEFHCPLSFSDHRMLIMKTTMRLKTKDISTTITKVHKQTAEHNFGALTLFNTDQQGETVLTNPRCSWNIEKPRLMNMDISIDYASLERERIREAKEKTLNKQQQIAYLTNKMDLSKNEWQALNNNLNLKKKAGMYSKNNDFPQILAGFKQHFRHSEAEPNRQNTETAIEKLLRSVEELAETCPAEKLFTPKSEARDFYGFRQKDIISNWQNISGKEIVYKITNIWVNRNRIHGSEMFFHNISNIILFKKTAEAQTWDKFRPIAIFPAWLMSIEKVVSKKVSEHVKQILSTFQYGFTTNRDIITAKLKAAQMAQENNFKFTVLLDLSKAYDCVNLEKLTETINAKQLNIRTKDYLTTLIEFYKQIKLNLWDATIQPRRGLPQGAPTSPILFNIYIDEILEWANTRYPTEARIAAYADDIVIQTTTIDKAQNLLTEIAQRLEEKELTLNISKTVLISQEEGRTLQMNNQSITSIKFSKYLGQTVDFAVRASSTINTKDYGRLLAVMQNNKGISRIGLVRLFHIYLRGKFNHLIPLIVQSNQIAETWQTLKKILFKYTLAYSTMPLESRNLLKIGFYHIIVRPLFKLAHRAHSENDEQLLKFINQGIKKAIAHWQETEPNLPDRMKETILAIIQANEVEPQPVEEWDKEVRMMAINRLLNYTQDLNTLTTIEKLIYPNIILAASMANIHMIQDAIISTWKKPNTRNSKEKTILKLIHKMTVILVISRENYEFNTELIDPDNLFATSEQLALIETDIKMKARMVSELTTEEAIQLKNETINNNRRPNNQANFTREHTKLEKIQEIQQEITTNLLSKTKDVLKAIEIGIEYTFQGITATTKNRQREITEYLSN